MTFLPSPSDRWENNGRVMANSFFEYRIDPGRSVVMVRAKGAPSDRDLHAFYQLLYEDPAWRQDYWELADFSQGDARHITAEGLREFAEQAAAHEGEKRTALVVPHDLTFGLARMYEELARSSPEEIRAFRELSEALAWLEISPAEYRAIWEAGA